jgi:predicted RNA-binding protein associated with RNAse of E/G family
MPRVEIHYHRPPGRLDVFVQELVLDRPDYKVTLHDPATLAATLKVGEEVIYEPGAAIVWFVFPDSWHDLGRFHLEDDTFTGYYVNLITPVQLDGATWKMFDLCLDLWVDADGRFQVLDQDEFDEAVDRHWIDPATAARARSELSRIVAQVRAGEWPPAVVREYDLARVRKLCAERG